MENGKRREREAAVGELGNVRTVWERGEGEVGVGLWLSW